MTVRKKTLADVINELNKIDLWDTNGHKVNQNLKKIFEDASLSDKEQKTVQPLLSIINKAISLRQVSKDRIIESQIINELNLNIITTLEEKKIIRQIESAARRMLATERILLFYLVEDILMGTDKTLSLEKIPTEFYYQIFNYRHIFTSEHPKHKFLNRSLGIKAQQVTFVPFTIKNEVHGFFLLFEDPQKFKWNIAITRLKFLANQASIALERLELIHALNRALRESQGLQGLTKMMLSIQELPSFFSNLLRQAQKIIGFNRILLSLYNPETEMFSRVSHVGISPIKFKKAQAIHPPISAITAIMQNRFRISNSYYVPASKVPVSIRSYQLYQHPKKTKERVANFWHKGDILLSPIYSTKREPLGYLSLGEPSNNLAPSIEKIRLLETFGDFLGLAIENNQLFEKIERLSHTDELTGVYNYRFLREKMAELINNDAAPFSIIMIDLDNFKQFNDRHGHLRGDRMLKDISSVLAQTVSKSGYVSRYGGDEFIILLPETDNSSALEYVKKIAHSLEPGEHRTVSIDFSHGIASFPHDGLNFGELLDHADQLVYREKARKQQ